MLALRTVARRFATARANFYDTLGVSPSASSDEIKTAYKALVKKYHPDVGGVTASEEKFRKVTEAYTVLYNVETRVKYDLLSTSEVAKVLDEKKDGLAPPTTTFAPHEHGYQRLKELAEERKRFNLDKFYRFRGGVPRPEMQNIRGNAEGPPGMRADTHALNNEIKDNTVMSPSADYVDSYQAELYKKTKETDAPTITKRKPYLPVDLDYNFHKAVETKKLITFWFGLGATIWGIYLLDEAPKYWNRLQIAQLLELKSEKMKPAGMRAVSLP